MKKILLSAVLFSVSIPFIRAQTLFGTTTNGGSDGGGTITKYLPATNTLIVAKSFESGDGSAAFSNLIQATNGKLYGMTNDGGSGNYGVIFSYDPVSSTYTKLMNLDGVNGANPKGSLMQANDGRFYGMTSDGGSSGLGVMFSFDPASSTYTKLIDFNGHNGASPQGSLMQASDGKVYGMTSLSFFSFDLSSATFIKLKDIGGTGGLMQASDGKLYGMADSIFSFDPSSSIYTKLAGFYCTIGVRPSGSLIQASDGKLYGMTYEGGSSCGDGNYGSGVIFSFDLSTSAYADLHDFGGTYGGGNPEGGLMQASDGKLYGVTHGGIFSFDPSSSAYTILNSNEGNGTLMQAGNGKLYGIAGTYIFSFDVSLSAYKILKDFSQTNGHNPSGGLLQAKDRKLYGMTTSGGSSNHGVIFSFDPSSFIYTRLKDFDGINGGGPHGSLIQAIDGKFYGMTYNGGSSDAGVIFSFDPIANTYIKLKDFDITNGGYPYGSLVQASNGKMYGMTRLGGTDFAGVLFVFDPSSSGYTKLKDLDFTNGGDPFGSLTQASDGKLYGITTQGGSSNRGSLFYFDPSTFTYSILKQFDAVDGGSQQGGLIQAKDGKLYGLTSTGGSNSYGGIFSYDPLSSAYTKLKNLDSSIGSDPTAGFMQASDGKFYSTTYSGGSKKLGVVFSFDPLTSVDTTLIDFIGVNGANPGYGSAFIEATPAENAPPGVSIKSPADNTRYTTPASITLVADAKDTDGSITKVEFYNGNTLLCTEHDLPYIYNWDNAPVGNYTITAKAYDNDAGVTTSAPVHISVVPNKLPAVSMINPVNGQNIAGPSKFVLEAAASDADGHITKVELYNGSTLLRTEYYAPFTWKWNDVVLGNYTITAKAYDNNGGVTTSAPVHISVVPNISPVVDIISPIDHQTFGGTVKNIILEAKASDADGRVVKVQFYNGETLLHNEYYAPFTYNWQYVHAGSYILTAKATDNLGKVTISAPVAITITSPNQSITGSQFYADNKTGISDAMSVKILPDPARNILNIHTAGFEYDKKITVSVISVVGVTVKIIYTTPDKTMRMDISSLRPGVYFLKAVSGDKIFYTQFVKL